MKKKQSTHYYISPVSGRVIKSSGKLYKELKKRRFIIDKDACLYNITSAKRCINSILNKYKGLVYPPSKFIDIPSTYHKKEFTSEHPRAFIKTDDKKYINGYIDKKGELYKIKENIESPKHAIPEVITLSHHKNILHEKLKKSKVDNNIRALKKQITSTPMSNHINIIHNPIQNDFIPVNGDIKTKEHVDILNTFNNELIPVKLPSINNTNISGVIASPTQILGFTDTNNVTKKFNTPIEIESEKESVPEKESESVPETESVPEEQTEKESESEKETESVPETESENIEPTIETKSEINIMIDIPKTIIDDKEIVKLENASDEEESKFLNELSTIEKMEKVEKMYEKMGNKCDYNLVWDSELKMCKIRENIALVVDNNENILGYTHY